MYIEHEFFVGFRDVDYRNNLKIKSALSYLEDIAGIHSNIAGYGLLDIEKNKKTWVLINWKVEFLRRPRYAENLKVKTWSNGTEKIYALRDFYMYDEKGEIVVRATSKWVLIDIEKMGIAKLTDEVMNAYTTEPDKAFDEKVEKLKEPEGYIDSVEVKITKDMIDVNGHVHNINYMDFVTQIMPIEVMQNAKTVEVLYKKEIRDVDKIKCFYQVQDGYHYVVIKSEDEQTVHAIVRIA
ncbi:MAG: hypothetical protein IJ867_06805 [Clostridia bacterium]|nr:hypothetical protein [Clostridia bacterium]